MSEPGESSRGAALSAALAQGVTDPARLALIMEAGRIVDRLDALDAEIAARGVDGLPVLTEARQQAGALRQIVAALGVSEATAEPVAQKGNVLDELAKRRAARESNT